MCIATSLVNPRWIPAENGTRCAPVGVGIGRGRWEKMWYKNLAIFLFCGACLPAEHTPPTSPKIDNIDVQVRFTKGQNSLDIKNIYSVEDLTGADAVVSIRNEGPTPSKFHCGLLKAQGVFNTYSLKDVVGSAPYSVSLAPVSSDLRSQLQTLPSGSKCTVIQPIPSFVLEKLSAGRTERIVRVLVRYTIPDDTAFGIAAGRSVDVVLNLANN